MFLQRGDHPGSGRKPRIEHIRVDNAPTPLQGVEFIADGREERAAVKTGRRFTKRTVQLPIDLAFESFEQFGHLAQSLPQSGDRRMEDFVGHGAGLDVQPDGFQADLQVKVQDLSSADRHDARPPMRLDPPERGVHQEHRHLPAAMRFSHG